MSKKAAIILVNYKDYAEKYLPGCLASIRRQDYDGEIKIFITDNESTEESYEYLKSVAEDKIPLTPFDKEVKAEDNPPYPPLQGGQIQPPLPPLVRGGVQFEIVRNKKNDGFAKGNNDAMKLALRQGFDYIILFNMDTVVAVDCVRKMVEVVEGGGIKFLDSRLRGNDGERGTRGEKIGAVQARLMLYDDRNKINSLGNVTHFLGFGYCLGYGEEKSKVKSQKSKDICYPSGAAALFTRQALEKVGLFDEEFWMYNEDQDLGWRLWLAGFKSVLAPEAAVYHKYEFSRSIKKYYCMDRNRIIAILKNYHWATLILILPAFLAMEIGLIIFSIKAGWFKEKLRVYKYFLSAKNWRYILEARRQTQKLRRVKDKDIVKLFSGRIWYQEIGEWRLKAANIVFNAYWKIIKALIRW